MEVKKVLVTGATGYIGSWVVKYLLEDGYEVNITVRNKSKKEKYAHLVKIAEEAKAKLNVFEADLMKEGSFVEPMQNCEVVYHIASPFIINNIKDPQKQLINPALEGTRNVLNTVNKTETVKRVVLTSSVVAVYGDAKDMSYNGLTEFNEEYWNTTSNLKHQPYAYSKVLAEREAQKMADSQSRWSLSIINPGFVMGPSLTGQTGSGSFEFMNDLISGKQKMGVPNLTLTYVDVRDIAKAHILAAEKNSDGRHCIVDKSLTMLDTANILREKFGSKYKLPKTELPKFMLYLFGWTQGVSARFISRNVGYNIKINNSKSKDMLGLEYRPVENSFAEMVEQMERVSA